MAVERTSMRAVARNVGLSARAVDLFLSGSKPRLATQVKLRAWYVRSASAMREHDAETVRAALDVLLSGLPEGARRKLLPELLERIQEEHRAVGVPVPKWIAALKREG
jgi:hypothetical protein